MLVRGIVGSVDACAWYCGPYSAPCGPALLDSALEVSIKCASHYSHKVVDTCWSSVLECFR